MITVLLTWSIIFIYAYIIGKFVVCGLAKNRSIQALSTDLFVVCGMCFMTVYAEFFSLIYKVGEAAFILLTAIVIALTFYLNKKGAVIEKTIEFKVEKTRLCAIVIVVIGVLLWTCITPQHYDTYLYHAQAIRWIEEYGIVPGLGNLHFRFAYNSAFMSLQALFSFVWITGQSLHTVNGFVTICYLVYVFITFGRYNKLMLSDFLKVCSLLYVMYDSFHVSSPNTDTFALLLVCYVCVKWAEYSEIETLNNSEYIAYAWLCVLLVYAATLKLSTGIMVLMVIYPLIIMIRQHRLKDIIKFFSLGVIVLCPYIIRNWIISGYLLYPYETSGLINTEWKMPESVLKGDRAEIIAWGRGNKDITRIGEPIWKWIGEWYLSINALWKIVFPIAFVSLMVIIIMIIVVHDIKNKDDVYTMILGLCIGFVFWIETAPLPRYGIVYSILIIGIGLYYISIKLKHSFLVVLTERSHLILLGFETVFLLFFFLYAKTMDVGKISFVKQNDYNNKKANPIICEDYVIYIPTEGDQVGYDPFPETVSYSGETNILLGEAFKDGFKAN